jgi:hypothetical protein
MKPALRIFRDGNADKVDFDYKPSAITSKSFNCFSGEFSDWLSVCAGADFASDGSTTLKEYVWAEGTKISDTASLATVFPATAQDYWFSTFAIPLIKAWASKPVGFIGWAPSSNEGDWYNIPSFSTELHSSGFPDDVYFAFGNVRVKQMKVRYLAKKVSPKLVQVINLMYKGYFTDLYDFSPTDVFPGYCAAVMQLGYGNGKKGAKWGHIFRSRVYFRGVVLGIS